MKRNLTELVFILDRSGSMSGLEADTGADHTDAPADLTVAFHAPKACHALAAQRCGKLALADIGIRRVLADPAEL